MRLWQLCIIGMYCTLCRLKQAVECYSQSRFCQNEEYWFFTLIWNVSLFTNIVLNKVTISSYPFSIQFSLLLFSSIPCPCLVTSSTQSLPHTSISSFLPPTVPLLPLLSPSRPCTLRRPSRCRGRSARCPRAPGRGRPRHAPVATSAGGKLTSWSELKLSSPKFAKPNSQTPEFTYNSDDNQNSNRC